MGLVIYLKFECGWLFTFVFLPVPRLLFLPISTNSYHCIIGLLSKYMLICNFSNSNMHLTLLVYLYRVSYSLSCFFFRYGVLLQLQIVRQSPSSFHLQRPWAARPMDNLVHWSNSVSLDSVLLSSGLLNGLSNCSIFACLACYLKAAEDP
jgi:hypothetical protein